MRNFWVLFACAIVASAAFAQTAPAPVRLTGIEWDQRPTAGDFERHFPRGAMDAGIVGTVQLCCAARADGALDCRTGHEWPANYGFGAAAVEIAKSFRMADVSLARYQSEPGAYLQIPITFQVFGMTDEDVATFRSVRDRIDAATEGLCAPPAIAR